MSVWAMVEKAIDDAFDFGEAMAPHLADVDNAEMAKRMRDAEKIADASGDAAQAAVERLEREHSALLRVYRAARYRGNALGRATYVPAEVCRIVREHWSDLRDSDCAVIQRDVRAELDRAHASGQTVGHECDDREWRSLLAWMSEVPGCS